MNEILIGIDCATVDNKIGVALGRLDSKGVIVEVCQVCSAEEKAADIIVRWLRDTRARRALLAIDAPLGWPKDLSLALADHRAGRHISIESNEMFCRKTDRFVRSQLGKTPLEVGADRIARTAYAALRLLEDVRRALTADLPLAWSPDWNGTAAIEVYPAATLLARGLIAAGYKKKRQLAERESLIESLRTHVLLADHRKVLTESADALDAAVCVLAAADFVQGLTHAPADPVLAEREGWIWFFRRPNAG